MTQKKALSIWNNILSPALLGIINKKASKNLLIERFSQVPGVSGKISQVLSANLESSKISPGKLKVESLSIEAVNEMIKDENPTLFESIDFISSRVHAASLGQVHRARIKGIGEVALKIQYPNVAENISEDLKKVFALTKIGPPQKYQFEAKKVFVFLEKALLEEVDYLHELRNQEVFYNLHLDSNIKIPKPFVNLSTKKILVQEFVSSQGLEVIKDFWGQQEQASIATQLLDFFFQGLFSSGYIHIDLHPENWGGKICNITKKPQLVVYDFGSTLKLESAFKKSLIAIVKALWANNYQQINKLLVEIGFCKDKISIIEDRMPLLMKALFKPLLENRAIKPQEWEFKNNINTLLDSDKWWFRTAGPPWLLLVMRSFSSIIKSIQRLGLDINYFQIINKYIHFDKKLIAGDDSFESCSPSKELIVQVLKNRKEQVKVSLPAHAIYNIEELIPQNALNIIKAKSIDLVAIKKNALQESNINKILLQTKYDNKEIKIWIQSEDN